MNPALTHISRPKKVDQEEPVIRNIIASAYTIPTETPESDGTIKWNSTTLVLVELEAGGKQGIGYSYTSPAAVSVINGTLAPCITGMPAMDIPALNNTLVAAVRNDGPAGIAMMAVSAVDNALWDLKAKLLALPLCTLLGMARKSMRLYGSGGFTAYDKKQLQQQLGGWAEAGIAAVKMKIGRDPDKDPERVKQAREAIGETTGLFVDANGGYTVKQALEKARQFAESRVSWYEEPVASSDLAGLRFIRDHVAPPVQVAAGEYGYSPYYFKEMLQAKAVDVLQADATRCGGITRFLQVASLAFASQVPFSSHCAPAQHLHAALAVPAFYTAEYFYDHVRIESMLFDGVAAPRGGGLFPDLSSPGIGLRFKHADAQPYKV